MNAAYIYLQLYKLFDRTTPIPADCGKLCGKACCQGTDSGMYLFPGEQRVFSLLSPGWCHISDTDFTYTYHGHEKKLPILFCSGHCDRFQRPLACRIFPLAPHLDASGKLEIIIDPRARAVCPLAKALTIAEYNPRFVRNVKKAFTILMQNREFREFMPVFSAYLDEFQKFYSYPSPRRYYTIRCKIRQKKL